MVESEGGSARDKGTNFLSVSFLQNDHNKWSEAGRCQELRIPSAFHAALGAQGLALSLFASPGILLESWTKIKSLKI